MNNDVIIGIIIIFFIVMAFKLFGNIITIKEKIKHFNIFLKEEFSDDSTVIVSNINNYFNSNKGHSLYKRWSIYFKSINRAKEIPDFYNYINKDYILYTLGSKKMIEIVPGILISLGILGTFLGLYMGLSGFDFSSEESLRVGIQTLIGGVSIAFLSSLVGISLSVLWLFLDKLIFNPLIEKHTNEMEEQLNFLLPKTEDEVYFKEMVNMQKENLEAFRTIVTDTLIPDLINGFKGVIDQTLVPQLEKNQESLTRNNDVLQEMAENTVKQQNDSLNAMTEHFLESLNNATGDHFNKLGESLDQMITWNQNMYENTSLLIEKVAENSQTQTIMGEKLESLSSSFNETINQITKSQFELNSTIEELNDVQEKLVNLQLATSNSLEQTMDRQKAMDFIQDQLRERLEEQLETMDLRMGNLKEYWTSSENNLKDLNSNLSESMERFAQHMHDGLERTFEQFDKNLKQAVEYLQTGVMNLEDVITDLPNIIEGFQKDLGTLQKSQGHFIKLIDTINENEIQISKAE